jgi:hypothetical protein
VTFRPRLCRKQRAALALALGIVFDTSAASAAPPATGELTETDRDQDGVTDAVESELGLDVDVVNIPEPLLFDMVRGLGARRGELEVNALGQSGPKGAAFGGGPEMEYVFAKGYGVEVELPVSLSGVEAWKASLQGTLPFSDSGRFTHGWLLTGEYLLGDAPGARATAVYIAALRFNRRWSAVTMLGGRTERLKSGAPRYFGVLNPSVFFDVSPNVTLGLEMNSLLEEDGTTDLVLLPQLHWQPSRSWKVQLGTGAHVDQAGATSLVALRLSYTF